MREALIATLQRWRSILVIGSFSAVAGMLIIHVASNGINVSPIEYQCGEIGATMFMGIALGAARFFEPDFSKGKEE